MIRKMSHATIFVTNQEEALSFYRRQVGLPGSHRRDGGSGFSLAYAEHGGPAGFRDRTDGAEARDVDG